jgi:hypothetical protein
LRECIHRSFHARSHITIILTRIHNIHTRTDAGGFLVELLLLVICDVHKTMHAKRTISGHNATCARSTHDSQAVSLERHRALTTLQHASPQHVSGDSRNATTHTIPQNATLRT